jgi:hypothetical protein
MQRRDKGRFVLGKLLLNNARFHVALPIVFRAQRGDDV